ncbi:MAG: hypothetical protein M0Z42_07610 [Actinomycetota bacterium]|nr:hypothetical protein [Actinomycetota bacterium]
MRRLRIAAPTQLTLDIAEYPTTVCERSQALPEAARTAVVVLLARMIAAGVVVSGEEVGSDGSDR